MIKSTTCHVMKANTGKLSVAIFGLKDGHFFKALIENHY